MKGGGGGTARLGGQIHEDQIGDPGPVDEMRKVQGRLLPRRIYYGVAGNQKRYFALKLPLAVDPETVTFAYVDPGHQTDTELRSWGAAHGPLWDALRKKGRQVRVIGIAVENATVDRADRVLETWAAAEPGTSDEEGLTAKQEIKAIQDALIHQDLDFFRPLRRSRASHEAGGSAHQYAPSQRHRRSVD